ncbi:MAG: Hsp33 family molecular chaperone HslO [Clostridiales bacterium]|nr:Hsp33 family molecular chaperone HslO [Clostridiales bacterium]
MNGSVIVRGLTRDGSARIILADTSEIVQKAHEIHGLSKTMTAALGRALTAASLMGSTLKGENDSLTLRFKGNGPAGTICCVSDSNGNVRGYADNPYAELPPNDKGKLDVGGAVGAGTMYVMRDLGLAEPYIGMSEIVSGEIAEDITQYYVSSEQTPTVCALGVKVNKDFSCRAAGGFLLQLMPYPDEKIIDKLESNIPKISSVSTMIDEGMTLGEIAGVILDGIEFDLLDENPIAYKCPCSREKYHSAIKSLKIEDLRELYESGEAVEACCNFCGSKYRFETEEVGEMLAEREDR